MLASEHAQQPQPASSLLLPQDHNAQTGPQHQSATSPLDQPQGVPVQHQPSGNDPTPLATETGSQGQPFGDGTSGTTQAQYQQSGEGHTSRNIAEAQLAQLISRDDDAEMPAAPLVHDLATPRRQVGGRCRKWAVCTQQTTDKRKFAACCMCGQQVSHGEARLQQWPNRISQRAYVRAHCVNGGVAHDHELHPKQPTDHDAVESVARQRDCVTQTAADSEILLSITASSDQASTAAPADDEQNLFGREEAPRLDEEIMNFQWFDAVTWDSIKDLRGTTYVQPPPRFRFALQQTQHAILRAIVQHALFSPASESAWKVLVLSSQLLLGRPVVNASESNCALFLEARLDLFWSEDWPALWAMVRAERDVAPVFSNSRKSATTQTQSRVRKVATLAQSGERGRALAAARNAHPVQIVQSLYPVDQDPAVAVQTPASHLFLSQVAELIPSTLRRMPGLSEPGPLGMRAERWQLVCASCCPHCSCCSPAPSFAAPQIWPSHTARQTCRRPQTTPHDVFSPQAGPQVSHGGQEGIGGQLRWSSSIQCGTP